MTINNRRHTFTDSQGTEWDVTLTIAGARRIDESDFTSLGVEDGFSILEPKRDIFNRILTDARLAIACVFAVVKPQVKDKLGIDPDTSYEEAEWAFMERLDGQAIQEAKAAFWETLSDFFPDQKAALSALKRAYDTAQKKIAKTVEMMESDISGVLERELQKETEVLRAELSRIGNDVGGKSSS